MCVCIHSSLDGHRLLPYVGIVSNAPVNIGCMYLFRLVFFGFGFFFGYIPRREISVLYGSSISVFLETSLLISIVTIPIYIPTNSVGGFPFLHILTNIYYLCSF